MEPTFNGAILVSTQKTCSWESGRETKLGGRELYRIWGKDGKRWKWSPLSTERYLFQRRKPAAGNPGGRRYWEGGSFIESEAKTADVGSGAHSQLPRRSEVRLNFNGVEP